MMVFLVQRMTAVQAAERAFADPAGVTDGVPTGLPFKPTSLPPFAVGESHGPSGKRRVVTGAASVIGAATTLELARCGSNLALMDRVPADAVFLGGFLWAAAVSAVVNTAQLTPAITLSDPSIAFVPWGFVPSCIVGALLYFLTARGRRTTHQHPSEGIAA